MNPDLRLRNTWMTVGYGLIALIVYLSLTTDPVQLDTGLPYQDKFMHALAYFVLMFWFGQIYHAARPLILWAVAFVFMGLLLEYLQSFESNRYSEVADMAANSFGVITGYVLVKTNLRNLLSRFERALF